MTCFWRSFAVVTTFASLTCSGYPFWPPLSPQQQQLQLDTNNLRLLDALITQRRNVFARRHLLDLARTAEITRDRGTVNRIMPPFFTLVDIGTNGNQGQNSWSFDVLPDEEYRQGDSERPIYNLGGGFSQGRAPQRFKGGFMLHPSFG